MLRFSIKDLLWLTVLTGIGVGWYLDHRAAAVRQQADGDALSTIDTAMQIHDQSIRIFQKQLDQLEQLQRVDKATKENSGR